MNKATITKFVRNSINIMMWRGRIKLKVGKGEIVRLLGYLKTRMKTVTCAIKIDIFHILYVTHLRGGVKDWDVTISLQKHLKNCLNCQAQKQA